MLPDAYLAAVARKVGVPECWIEDYCQDFRVEMWRKPHAPEKLVARSRAIDAARHHRKTVSLSIVVEADPKPITLAEALPDSRDFTREVITRLDAEVVLRKLPPYMQRAIGRALAGLPQVNLDGTPGGWNLGRARKRARELAA